MKAVLRLTALLLSISTAAVAAPSGTMPEPDFLLPLLKASKGGEAKPGTSGYSTSTWYTCTFNCADGHTNYANCNTALVDVATCCAFSGDPNNPNPNSCGQHGGLIGGSCSHGGDTQYCP